MLNIKKMCYSRNIDKNEVMIGYELRAKRKLYENLLDEIDNTTVVDMNLPILVNGMIFRTYSPFMRKFSESEMRFKEFGLEAKWALDLKIRRPEKKTSVIETDDHGLVKSLTLFLLIGWGVSITVFFLELLWYHVITKLNVLVLEEPMPKKSRNVRIQIEN